MTAFDHIVVAAFCFTMFCNVVALIRHWRMMRVMQIALNNLIETQNEFNKVMADDLLEKQKRLKP